MQKQTQFMIFGFDVFCGHVLVLGVGAIEPWHLFPIAVSSLEPLSTCPATTMVEDVLGIGHWSDDQLHQHLGAEFDQCNQFLGDDQCQQVRDHRH